MLINTYIVPTVLLIDGEEIYSRERTTQGDLLGMPVYAIATIPLIRRLPKSVTQIWYADDATAFSTITGLRDWWDNLTNLGPGFGYHANSAKTWLVTKDSYLSDTVAAFVGTNVNVTCSGRPHLGVSVGSPDYCESFVVSKVDQWSSELKLLSEIATTQPHAARCIHPWVLQQMVIPSSHRTKPHWSLPTSGEHQTLCLHPNSYWKTSTQWHWQGYICSACKARGCGSVQPHQTVRFGVICITSRLRATETLYLAADVRVFLWVPRCPDLCLVPHQETETIQRQENATHCQATDNLKQHLSPAGKKALELAGERSFQLANLLTHSRVWFQSPSLQGCICGCPVSPVWVASPMYSNTLCVWYKLLRTTYPLMPSWRFSINPPQRNQRRHRQPANRSLLRAIVRHGIY